MKSLKRHYLDCVDGRLTDAGLFAPLTDGLFAAGMKGSPWVSDVTPDEQIEAAVKCGVVAGFVQGSSPDLTVNPSLAGLVATRRTAASDTERAFEQTIATPSGTLVRRLVEQPGRGITAVSDWLDDVGQLPVADWISEQILAGARDAAIRDYYRDVVRLCGDRAVSQVQLELPYFLYALPGFADKPLMLYMTEPERFGESMQRAEAALHHVARLLVEVGIDFIWIGAPGTELLSPDIWEAVVIPQSRRMMHVVKACGGRVHFHCCGQSRLWIEKGYYNRIGMDLVETLSPPPAGNVEDLAWARAAIDRAIVTRGNIDLELLRTGTPAACAVAARAVMAATRGWPHIIGGADAILYGTPPANLAAVRDACACAVACA